LRPVVEGLKVSAKIAVLAFVALVVVGCYYGVFAVPIYDVTLVSLEPGNDPDCPGGNCPKILELRFRTAVNLRRLIHDTDAITPLLIASLCPFDDERYIWASTIRHNGVEITVNSDNICTQAMVRAGTCTYAEDSPDVLAEMESMKTNQPLIYTAYINYQSVGHFDEKAHTTVFEPLPKTPQDLCFKVISYGEGFTPRQFASSTVRIPVSALRHALQEPAMIKRPARTN
jgi:hypothetical protein